MIIYNPDFDGEEFVFENEWDTAIPVNFRIIDGEVTVSYFPRIESKIKTWATEHEADLFSDSALQALWSLLKDDIAEWGYEEEPHRERWGHILRTNKAHLQSNCILDSTVRMRAEDEDRNDTSYDIEMSLSDGCAAFGTVCEGRITSIAVTHNDFEDADIVEIGVETCKGMRGKGMASSNLAALSDYLLSRGVIPEYRCFFTNEASRKTAMKAGFFSVGKYYYYVLRRKANT